MKEKNVYGVELWKNKLSLTFKASTIAVQYTYVSLLTRGTSIFRTVDRWSVEQICPYDLAATLVRGASIAVTTQSKTAVARSSPLPGPGQEEGELWHRAGK